MDEQQLKLLAGRVRGLLEQSHVEVSHNQALDLSSALVGLRNWPEVRAFSQRLAGSELDAVATARLAHRLKKRHAVDLSAEALLHALRPPSVPLEADPPQIWPSGPRAGVYVTTDPAHIAALLERYDDATDGALVYAERAGNHWDSSIDLGEYGLWSSGLNRVPSGTLIVVGPLELNQQAWDQAADRLEMACLRALGSGHRVAVLVDTHTPETLAHDLDLMVRLKEPEGGDTHEALVGVVDVDGTLTPRHDPVSAPPLPTQAPIPPQSTAPAAALSLLTETLAAKPLGLVVVGTSEIQEHWAADLIDAVLPLTAYAGPAARIKPRNRGTPAKDWMVPPAIKALPFLPSIQSAYSLGYRRMIINPGYTDVEQLLEYGSDVLFIAGAYGSSVDDVFMSAVRYAGMDKELALLEQLVAVLAVTRLRTARMQRDVADLYVHDGRVPAEASPERLEDVLAMLTSGRALRAEDELASILDEGRVSAAAVKKAIPRVKWAMDLIAARSGRAVSN